MQTTFDGVVVGYGSIGRRHAPILAERVPRFAIVDQGETARTQAQADLPQATVVANLADLDRVGWNWANSCVVIATWGPSHAGLFHELADRGVKRILCEKPMAHSWMAAQQMVERAEREQIRLGVNHQHRYSGLIPAIQQLAEQFELGEPVLMTVEGGAKCLVTTGIHYLDLAAAFLGGDPTGVISTARGERINPRDSSLDFFGGTAVWSYPKERELVISFSNHSSVVSPALLYYRDAVIEFDQRDRVVVRRRPREDVQKFPAITRCGVPNQVLYDAVPPTIRPLVQRINALLDELLEVVPSTYHPAQAASVVGGCIGALAAGQSGQRVALPLSVESAMGQQSWPMS